MPEKRRFPHTAEALRTFFRKKKVTDFAPLEAFLGLKPGYFRTMTSVNPAGRPSQAVLTRMTQYFGLKTLPAVIRRGYEVDNVGVVKPCDVVNADVPPAARWLRENRVKAKLSQAELSRRLSVSPTVVSRVERGRHRPTNELLRQAAEVFAAPVPQKILDENATERYQDRWGITVLPTQKPRLKQHSVKGVCPYTIAALREFLIKNGITSIPYIAEHLEVPEHVVEKWFEKNSRYRPTHEKIMALMALTGRSYIPTVISNAWYIDIRGSEDPDGMLRRDASPEAMWLRRTRLENLCTVAELADRLGLTEDELRAMENDRAPIQPTLLTEVADKLKVSLPRPLLAVKKPVFISLGQALREIRVELGYSRRIWASAMKVSQNTLKAMEIGDGPVSDENLKSFASVCGFSAVPKEWLLLRKKDGRESS